MPMRGELPVVAARAYPLPSTTAAVWSYVLAIVTNPDLQCVVAFCTIGILVTVNVIARFPDLGELIASSIIFP
jgi:hypothetical protein